MRAATLFETLSRFSKAMKDLVRGPEFTCGDCDRNARCGLAPSPECIIRAEQIARAGERPERRRTVIGL